MFCWHSNHIADQCPGLKRKTCDCKKYRTANTGYQDDLHRRCHWTELTQNFHCAKFDNIQKKWRKLFSALDSRMYRLCQDGFRWALPIKGCIQHTCTMISMLGYQGISELMNYNHQQSQEFFLNASVVYIVNPAISRRILELCQFPNKTIAELRQHRFPQV